MGGINHQPCGSYLVLSTKISAELSLMQVAFWQANVELEKAILSGLKGKKVKMTTVLDQLNSTIDFANKTSKALAMLITKLDSSNFQELPETVEVLDLMPEALRRQKGIIFSKSAVSKVTDILIRDGFRGLFKYYQGRISSIKINLQAVGGNFKKLSKSSNLVKDCEENSTDIRINFTRTMLLIHRFMAEWAFSSLASATMWNLNQGHQTTIVSLDACSKEMRLAVNY